MIMTTRTGIVTGPFEIGLPPALLLRYTASPFPEVPCEKGNGSVVGSSTVYFLQAPGAPQTCQSGVPLTYLNIGVYRIDATDSFNLTRWSGKSGTAYSGSANAGVLSSTQPGGSIY